MEDQFLQTSIGAHNRIVGTLTLAGKNWLIRLLILRCPHASCVQKHSRVRYVESVSPQDHARSVARSFVLPVSSPNRCADLGYDIDTSYELANLTSHQEWLQTLAHEFTLQERNCALDMRVELGPKACLTMQQVHRHLQARATCELSLEEGFL